ncbi:MAG: hypothetical protein ACK4QP_03635 [Pseudorhizobium sp.]
MSKVLACVEGADSDLNEITSSELAVDGEIVKRTVSHSPLAAREEANGPDLALFQRLLDAPFEVGCILVRDASAHRGASP